ncbi:GntR family transcriptional regulator [Salipiger aestuarii]|uniref:GntR family phosphonate transport system transcriptional regulator n=1 Tax=Salipiger aestuarii TaxID=568098 RepID=A0A327YRW1_9RHOB|nr:phosphonate metabolism transcriptional regulator PhnF [Salipiger aestuarii]EIE49246.1 GntR family transcriptional regulator [Citreicella sp. 357]KAA8609765.1 GntR family transcriptional regulator [Salipiger aestuarii]KAA8614096.1 GntR family transcriptional regulator [Salipiger aestuarii]KAB2543609.1 GntR family transcriptional regulator [Salipiger aestuarii]RAK22837.1 GntR family phosphonate transport system transcriptional regulator [Salipiger aestuarii]
MPRVPVWKSIATELEGEIARGLYRPGDKLPTEAELSRRFGVNRHTARRALGDMAARAVVHSKRGAGVFVTSAPLDYPIGGKVRFAQNIRASGRLPGRRSLRIETRPSSPEEATALALHPGAPVIVYEGLSLAEDVPIAHFISCFPTDLLPDLAVTLEQTASITEALRSNGIPDYTRISTRLSAVIASPTQALHLGLRDGAPLLRSESVNHAPGGRPVEYGLTWFAGDRITLIVGDTSPG